MKTIEETQLNKLLELSDKAGAMCSTVEKIRILAGEISCDFFGKCDANNETHTSFILYNFKKHGVKTDMIVDYIIQMKKTAKEINDGIENLHNILCEKD